MGASELEDAVPSEVRLGESVDKETIVVDGIVEELIEGEICGESLVDEIIAEPDGIVEESDEAVEEPERAAEKPDGGVEDPRDVAEAEDSLAEGVMEETPEAGMAFCIVSDRLSASSATRTNRGVLS